MKTNVAAVIALAALAAASPLSTTVASRAHTRPLHITITSTETASDPTDIPTSKLNPFSPFNQEPGPVIDPNFGSLPLETTAAPATTSVPGGGGGGDDDDDGDDEPDAGESICLLPEGCGPSQSEAPPSMTDLLCFLPEGCRVELRTGAIITIPAGLRIPTALLRPTATASPTARRGHHDDDDDDRPVITTTAAARRHPIHTGPPFPPWPACEKDKGAFGCLSKLPPGVFVTLGADGKERGPAPTDVAVPPE